MSDFLEDYKEIRRRLEAIERTGGLPDGAMNPTGVVLPFAGASAPSGYLLADGSAVSRTTYAALFTAIGTAYGIGDGSTTFNLPNLKGKVPVGKDAGQTEFDTLAETGGAKTHTLITAEMPTHTHIQNSHLHTSRQTYRLATSPSPAYNGDAIVGSGGAYAESAYNAMQQINTGSTTPTNQDTGGNGAHNNLQPYIVLNYIIKT